jgi:DNA-binding CsgD family transcriptional regulator
MGAMRGGALVEAAPLERTEQLSLLSERLVDVTVGSRGRMVVLEGEAGVGKTALLERFRAELGPAVRVLWSACDPLFTPRPLGPLLDVARLTGGELEARVEQGAKPYDVAAALRDELVAPAPTLLVIEDVHWADEATLDVLRVVARRIESVAALLVTSHREEELGRAHPLRILLGELPRRRIVTRIRLSALSREAVAALAGPSGLDSDELYDRTAGNPFYVTEALAAEAETVPSTVRDAVLARAARLSPAARELLDAISVVPQPTELWLLEALAEGGLDKLEDCLTSGMLMAQNGCVAFRHELARLAIEGSLAPDRRLALHRRALATLAERDGGARDLARLAHHADAAGDDDAVLRFATAAAEHASAVGAHVEAQNQYARALRFAGGVTSDERTDLLERFAGEAYLTDMRDAGVEALDEALSIYRERGDLVRQGDALRLRARLLICVGRVDEARSDLEEAVEALEQVAPGHELARAYGGLSQSAMFADRVDEAIAWGTQAIELAERVGDTEALVFALNNVGTVELGEGNHAGREKLERSREIADAAGLDQDVGRADINLAAMCIRLRDWATVDACTERGIEYCRGRGMDAWMDHLVAGRAESRLAQGHWSEAAELALSIVDGRPASIVGPRHEALCVLALVRARRGDPGYQPLLDEVLEVAESVGDLQYVLPTAVARAEVAWLEGRLEDVAPATGAALELAQALGADWCIAELACWRRRGGVDEALATRGDDPYVAELAGEFERAAEQWTALGCPYEAALALAGTSDEDCLRRSHAQLQKLGAAPAAATLARRLRERGARGVPRGPRAATRENPAGLTARESEVLGLVAAGLRNADIAARLFLSERTVGHHVSAILRKLGVRTRGEAAAEAVRLGITSPQSGL